MPQTSNAAASEPPPLPIEVEPASFLAAQERLAPERRG
jgi:hypothetical protein